MGRFIGIDLSQGEYRAAVLENSSPRSIPFEGGRSWPAIIAMDDNNEYYYGSAARTAIAMSRATPVLWFKRPGGSKPCMRDMIAVRELSAGMAVNSAGKVLRDAITGVVAAVPPTLTPDQRQTIADMIRHFAPVDAIRLVSQTTAVALANTFPMDRNGRLLVCSFDHDGFTATTLELTEGVYEELSHARSPLAGTAAFDERLTQRVCEAFRWQTGIDLKKDARSMERLKLAVGEARAKLCVEDGALIYLPFISKGAAGPINLEMTVSRQDFEDMCALLSYHVRNTVEQAMRDAGLKPTELDRVLIAGGPGELAVFRESIHLGLGGAFPVNRMIQCPDDSAALGAAIFSGVLTTHELSDLSILDCMAWTLSMGLSRDVAQPLIEKGTTYPIIQSYSLSTASDNQTSATVPILIGDDKAASKNTIIGRVKIEGIPPAPVGKQELQLTVEVRSALDIIVGAKDAATGKPLTVSVEGCLKVDKACRPPEIIEQAPPPQTPPSDEVERTRQEVIEAILPGLDNLELALKSSRGVPGAEAICRGVEMTLRGLLNSLKAFGLEEIPALGQPFDPYLHHAVATEISSRPNIVLEVIQTGYRMNGRVIRYAKVKVGADR